jgi:hypothetical protein
MVTESRGKSQSNLRYSVTKYKSLMIEKYDGLVLSSLNVILHKYQHYSELHYNILIIIFQVINSVEPRLLVITDLIL